MPHLRDPKVANFKVSNFYCDVFFHCENNVIIESHKIILAQHSPFLHKFFMSRKALTEVDMFFSTTQESVVRQSKTVEVDEKYRKRVYPFLKMLKVDFEIVTETIKKTTEEIPDLNRNFDKPDIFVTPSSSKEPEPVLTRPSEQVFEEMLADTEENDSEILNLNDWTVTTATDRKVSKIDHSWQRLRKKEQK